MGYVNTEERSLREIRFNFGHSEGEPVWEGFTDNTFWNGFTNVWVKPEVRDAIANYFTEQAQEDKSYIEEFSNLEVKDGLVCLAGGFATMEVRGK